MIRVLLKNLLGILKRLLELFIIIELKHLIEEVFLTLLEAVCGCGLG
jgi:hypothetical protein